ncbi:MAG: transposase [Anaerolineaceae bacterium]|nr:transposase [Anaerolineaceae bacterium]
MPRQARKLSESGFMHLTIRGNGRQIIFVDKQDYLHYLSLLKRFSIETSVDVCAFCLMDNHVHLLVFDQQNNTSLFMQKLGVGYAGYFNKKYQRSGHLFEDRYQSKPIEDEWYLLKVFHYILNNPRQANLCYAADYEWNSYHHYGSKTSFVKTVVFVELIGSRDDYAAFIAKDLKYDEPMELEPVRKDDNWALSIIKKELSVENGLELKEWSWERRNAALKLLKEKGLKIKQIERLTGINRGTIQKA